jgi:hypothetical protein
MLHPTFSSSKDLLTCVPIHLFILLIPAFISFGNAATVPRDSRELHVLNRLAFGPRPGDIQRVRSMGVDQYIAEQLSPDSIPLPPTVTGRLDGLATLRMSSPQLFLDYGPPSYGLGKG